MGGRVVGEVFEGQRRFFLQVRFAAADRQNLDRIQNVRVADANGRLIPISQLADIRIEEGPAQISRENIHRRLAVETNVRGRDLASFVADAQRAVDSQVTLDMSTTPLSTATPKRAMNPTPAEIENGIPRSASATMPPVAARGTFR